MNKNQRKIKKMVFKNLNEIYTTSNAVAKEWDSKAIPLNTLKTIIEKSKPDIEDPDENLMLFKTQFNNMLDTMYKICQDKAKEMGVENVSVEYIKTAVNHAKANMGL